MIRAAALVFSVVLMLAASEAVGVDFPLRWRWSNPSPHGGNVVDMAYAPLQFLGVQVAEHGQIYTSADLDLWLPRDSNTTNSLRAVTFFGTRVVITGENGSVLYSDDGTTFHFSTLLDGPTTDWLEAVTASPALTVAVGDNGAVYTSSSGIAWKRQTNAVTNWLRGVAFGNGTFVAVGEQGTVLRSLNGTNWSKSTSGVMQHLNRVTFNAGRFYAVGNDGRSIVSTNLGGAWFSETTGATNDLEYGAASGADRIVVGYSEVRINDDGVWSNELAKTNGPPDWTYYSCVPRPGFFLIAGQSGLQSEGYQPTNGVPYFWLTPYDSVRNWLWDVLYVPSLYVAVGDYGTVMTSGNGVNWTLELLPQYLTNTTFLGVGGTTNLLLAVGSGGSTIYSPNNFTNVVVTNLSGTISTQTVSTLGVIWHPVQPPPTTNDMQGVAVLSNSLYVITGDYGLVMTSSDGTNWTQRMTPTTKLLTSVASWPGGLVASGDDGTLITSPDGVRWTARSSGTTNWLYRVRYLNGTLIVVGQNGTILTSSSGTNWTPRASGTTKWINDVTFIQDMWFIVGTGGTVLTSTNLANWTSQGTLTKKALYGAATDSRQLVSVGVEGVILRSPVVPDLTPITILDYARLVNTNAPDYAQNVYLFGGHADQRFTLDYHTNLSDGAWTAGALLEFFDASGTLYYVETISGTNQNAQEFYRATLAP
jgi:hypothetical protein